MKDFEESKGISLMPRAGGNERPKFRKRPSRLVLHKMRDARRSYANAVGWIRSTNEAGPGPARWALRALDIVTVAGMVLLGTIGLLSPASFGNPGATPFRSGWPWMLLLAVVVLSASAVILRWRELSRSLKDIQRGVGTEEALEGASASLAAAPSALQTRFAFGWVWGPSALVFLAATFALAASYFAVDAILARFQIGWQQPTLGVANAVISFVLFRLAAPRARSIIVSYRSYRKATG